MYGCRISLILPPEAPTLKRSLAPNLNLLSRKVSVCPIVLETKGKEKMEEEDGAVAAEIAKNPEIISGELF